MGLLEKFAAKAITGIARAGVNATTSETGKYESLAKKAGCDSFSDKDIAANRVVLKTTGGFRANAGGRIDYPEREFEVTLLEVKTFFTEKRTRKPYTAQITVFIALPSAESLVCEKYASIGATAREAIEGAADKFSAFLNTMFDTIDGKENDILINLYDGNEHTYRYSTDGITACVGGPALQELSSFFGCISTELAGYLGAKKYYWLSLNIVFDDEETKVDCSLNGERIGRLSDILRDAVSDKIVNGVYGNFQQQMLIIQSNHTYVKAKENYNKARNDIHKYVREVIPLMGNSSAILVSYNELFRKVQNVTGDKNTAWELMTFLPEIYVQQVFKVKSTGLIKMKLGDKELDLTETQLNALFPMKTEVESYLENNSPSEEFQQNIFSLSSRFKAAVDALNSGVKEEDLAFGVLCCTAPDDYIIW